MRCPFPLGVPALLQRVVTEDDLHFCKKKFCIIAQSSTLARCSCCLVLYILVWVGGVRIPSISCVTLYSIIPFSFVSNAGSIVNMREAIIVASALLSATIVSGTPEPVSLV